MSTPAVSNVKTTGDAFGDSPAKVPLLQSSPGVVCVFQRNARDMFVVPSTHNWLEFNGPSKLNVPGVQIMDVKLDIGATTSLFYFTTTAALVEFVKTAPLAVDCPTNGVLYNTKETISPGGQIVTLKITRVHGFRIRLATDVMSATIPVIVPHVVFQLCTDDLNALIDTPSNLPESVVASLTLYRNNLKGKIVPRRKWAILGNDVTNQYALFKARNVFFMCDMKIYQLPSFDHLLVQEIIVINMNYLRLEHQIDSDVIP